MATRRYVGDPFVDVPNHARAVPTERLRRWAVKGECLCGCETVTRFTEYGFHSYFVMGHSTRVRGPMECMTTDQRARARKKSVVGNERHYINCTIIASLIRDYLEENNKSVRGFAKEIKCSETWIGDILRGEKRRIQRRSAIRLLRAIKEPVPEALYKPAPLDAPATGRMAALMR